MEISVSQRPLPKCQLPVSQLVGRSNLLVGRSNLRSTCWLATNEPRAPIRSQRGSHDVGSDHVSFTRDRFAWGVPLLTAAALAALAVGVALNEEIRNPPQRSLDAVGIALLLAGSLPFEQ